MRYTGMMLAAFVAGLAVVAGLSDEKKWPSIRALFDTTFLAGPYLEKYILESYFVMNDAQAGMERMKKRYEELAELIDDQHDYVLAADRVRRLMFLEKLLFEIDDAMAAIEN